MCVYLHVFFSGYLTILIFEPRQCLLAEPSTLKPRFNGLNGESTCPLLENDRCLVFDGTDTSIIHMVHTFHNKIAYIL